MNNPSQYPFDPRVPRRVIVAETGTVAEVKAKLEQLAETAAKKRRDVPVLTVPPVQTPEERGQGNSTNARLHRLIGAKR